MDIISNLISYNQFYKRIEALPLNPFRIFLKKKKPIQTSDSLLNETIPVNVQPQQQEQYVLP